MMKTAINLIIITALFITGCSSISGKIAGGGTDVSNPNVIGIASTSTGAFATGSEVKLIPIDHIPLTETDDIQLDTVDENGKFSFIADTLESYNILIRHNSQDEGVFLGNITPSKTFDSLRVVTKPYGMVSVEIPSSLQGGMVYFQGTDIIVNADSKTLNIPNLPSGELPSLYAENGTVKEKLANSVVITSGDTTMILYNSTNYEFSVLMLGINSELTLYNDLVLGTGGKTYETTDLLTESLSTYDIIYISYKAELTSEETSLIRNSSTPVICSNPELFPELGYTNNISNNYGYESWNSVIVQSDTSAIISGLFEEFDVVELYSESQKSQPVLAWGTPWGTSQNSMVGVADQGMKMLFTFESGKQMNGVVAPARRVALGTTQTLGLQENAKSLFKRCLLWANSNI